MIGFTTYKGGLTMAAGFSPENRRSVAISELYDEIERQLGAFIEQAKVAGKGSAG